MQPFEHPLQQNTETQPLTFSPTKFFHDAYDKALTVIEDHPTRNGLSSYWSRRGCRARGSFSLEAGHLVAC